MRKDYIPGTNLEIYQKEKSFSFGVDAVLLSSFAGAAKRCIDFGCGNGILILRMLGLNKIDLGVGVEIQSEVAEMASESVLLNNLQDKIKIINGSLVDYKRYFERNSVDLVISNPPYIKAGGGIVNTDDNHAISRHEIHMTFKDLVEAAAFTLQDGGSFCFVHKPERLPELFDTLSEYRLEPKRIRLVQPEKNKPANMVLIEAKKGGGEFVKFLPTLNVYENGTYTEELLQEYGEIIK